MFKFIFNYEPTAIDFGLVTALGAVVLIGMVKWMAGAL
jgi:Flp pilus assembly pilin Flp